jgi:undecaprenyl-diphosphatase
MSKKKKILLIISIIFFSLLVLLYLFSNLSPIDNLFYNIIISFKSELVTNILKVFTHIGGGFGVITLIIIIFIINRKKGMYFLLNICFINIINQGLKFIFARPRPDESIRLIKESGYSFPSGHTMNAVAAYGLIIYFILTSKLSKKIKYMLSTLLTLMMMFIPLSRVYLGVHYFTDIVAGSAVSLIWLVFYTEYLKKKDI